MTATPERVLVLGGNGMLGHEAVHVLADEFEVHASVRDPAALEPRGLAATLHTFDAGRPEDLPTLLGEARPDVVLNCIGIVKQLAAAKLAIPSIAINSLFPHQLAATCADAGCRLIHVSTDCVFSGRLAPPARYTEDDLPDPIDLYGRSKLLGEVMESGALTLRTSIIGWELDGASGLLEWTVSQRGRAVRGFTNALFSGLTTRALARVISELIRDHPDLEGLVHVAAEPISKFDLLVALDEALELDLTIEPADEPRINRALDPTRFESATGIAAPAWDAMISECVGERTP